MKTTDESQAVSPEDRQPAVNGLSTERESGERPMALFFFLVTGVVLGILFIKGEVVSWFRIQEMFRLQSIHM